MKALLIALTLSLPSIAAAESPAEQQAGKLVCKSASRGLQLTIPGGSAGVANGPVRINRLKRTIVEVQADRIVDYVNDGNTVSLTALAEGSNTQVLSLKGTKNEFDRYVVTVRLEGYGLIGFYCAK